MKQNSNLDTNFPTHLLSMWKNRTGYKVKIRSEKFEINILIGIDKYFKGIPLGLEPLQWAWLY